MSIVAKERMKELSKKFRKCREVTKTECPFSKNCCTCMYNVFSQDSYMDAICTRLIKEV